MPNPRYLSRTGEPTVELLDKLTLAKRVIVSNLPWFCDKWGYDPSELAVVKSIYLIGSHAEEKKWKNPTSDLDLKVVNPEALPENLHNFRREVLRPLLMQGEKHRWIDLFFVREEYQVLPPSWDLTSYWDRIEAEA